MTAAAVAFRLAQTQTVAEEQAREDAREILSRPPFDPVDPPRPFRGVLEQLGEWLRPVGRPVGDAVEWLTGPGPHRLPLLLLVFVLAVLLTARLARTRTAAGVMDEGGGRRRGRRDDPDELDRAADQAEQQGDLAAAVRLRFRAGLLRLDAAGVIDLRPSLTAGDLVRQVRSPRLRELVRTFEAVAYGGRDASPQDVDAARRGWPQVLADVRTEVLAAA